MNGFEMDEWADLIDELRRLREPADRPWRLTCDRGGCSGMMFRGRCRSCGAPR